jgi:1,4-alpha-glucan branching enzyme
MAGGGVAMVVSRARATASPTAIAAASPLLTTVLPVRFSVVAPRAAQVSIVGDFNHWNPTTLPMRRSADGQTWEVEVKLPVGRYSYAFLIDGAFAPDPAAPRGSGDDFGTPNSVLMVRGS